MKTGRHNGFWSGGAGVYDRALRKEEEEALQPLKDSLRVETDPELKRKLKEQIKAIQVEFRKKRKAAGSSLFTRT